MSNFFHAIFLKVISAVASVIIAIGIVHVPPISDQPAIVQKQPAVQGISTTSTTQEVEKPVDKKPASNKQSTKQKKPLPTPTVATPVAPDPAPIPTPVPAPPQLTYPVIPSPNDSLIKIEKCKTEKEIAMNNFLVVIKAAINEAIQQRKTQELDMLSPITTGLRPGDLGDYINSMNSRYQQEAQQELAKAQAEEETLLNQRYIECINN